MRPKNYAIDVAVGLLGVITLLLACAVGEGVALDTWVIWYLLAVVAASGILLVYGLRNRDEQDKSEIF